MLARIAGQDTIIHKQNEALSDLARVQRSARMRADTIQKLESRIDALRAENRNFRVKYQAKYQAKHSAAIKKHKTKHRLKMDQLRKQLRELQAAAADGVPTYRRRGKSLEDLLADLDKLTAQEQERYSTARRYKNACMYPD